MTDSSIQVKSEKEEGFSLHPEKPIKKQKVVIYARTSLADSRQNPETQLIPLKAYIEKRKDDGWILHQVIIDRMSGGKGEDERTGIAKALDMAHKREYDILLVYALDRLSREGTLKVLQYLQELETNNIKFVSYTEKYINSLEGPFKSVILSLLGSLAEVEKEKIRTRVREGLNRCRLEGRKLGRPSTKTNRMKIAKELKSQGKSLRDIGQEMGISRQRAWQLLHNK